MSENQPHRRRLFGRQPKPRLHQYKVYIYHQVDEEAMAQLKVEQIEDTGQQLAVANMQLMHHLGLRTRSIGVDYAKDRISGWAVVMLPNDSIAMDLLDQATRHVNQDCITVQVIPQEPIDS